METSKNETQPVMKFSFDENDLSEFIGKDFLYKYNNGWKYELYVKNSDTLDYRIHSGPYADRWVKNQRAFIVRLGRATYKASWTEPTGTSVSVVFNLDEPFAHGTVFFPRWAVDCPEKTRVFQNDHLDRMEEHREMGPAYPTKVINEFARIFHVGDHGPDDENVISCCPKELPKDYPFNLKSKATKNLKS